MRSKKTSQPLNATYRRPDTSIEALYAAYGCAVRRRCSLILGDTAESDDAVQEVFIRVLRYGDTRTGDAPLPWLHRIAARVCHDILNDRKRSAPPPTDGFPLADPAADDTPREDFRALHEVLEVCKTDVRNVAVLYHFDQLTQAEVAARVGVSRKTVKQRLAKFMTVARCHFGLAPHHTRAKTTGTTGAHPCVGDHRHAVNSASR